MRRFALLALLLPVLTACGGSDKVVLDGTREQVLHTKPLIKPDPEIANMQVTLPAPVEVKEWNQIGAFADHAPQHIKLADKVTPAWDRSVGGGVSEDERLLNPPVVGGGKLFVLTPESVVVALDVKTGKRVWKKSVDNGIDDELKVSGGLALGGGTLFVTTPFGTVYALNPNNGDQIWETEIGAPVRAAPTVADGRVFVVSHDNRLHVLSATDGSLVWAHSGIEEGIGLLGGAAPAVSKGIVLVTYSSGEIFALRAEDGKYIWNDALSVRIGTDPFSSLTDILAPPVVIGNVVYAVNLTGQMVVFDLQTGRRIWTKELSSASMPLVAGPFTFLVTQDNKLVAVHRERGQIRWVLDLDSVDTDKDDDEVVYWMGPLLVGDRLIVVSSNGYAASVSPYTGKPLSLVKISGSGLSVPPVVADGTLFFYTNNGKVVAYR